MGTRWSPAGGLKESCTNQTDNKRTCSVVWMLDAARSPAGSSDRMLQCWIHYNSLLCKPFMSEDRRSMWWRYHLSGRRPVTRCHTGGETRDKVRGSVL